nr:hypothetical protein [Tanacetum cinerariifolium]
RNRSQRPPAQFQARHHRRGHHGNLRSETLAPSRRVERGRARSDFGRRGAQRVGARLRAAAAARRGAGAASRAGIGHLAHRHGFAAAVAAQAAEQPAAAFCLAGEQLFSHLPRPWAPGQ